MKTLTAELCDHLEKIFHEPKRLALVSALAAQEKGLPFTALKEDCDCTDGNLNRHLKVLEEHGVVQRIKVSEQRRSITWVRLTEPGREAFLRYLQVLEGVLQRAAETLELSHKSALPLEPLEGLRI